MFESVINISEGQRLDTLNLLADRLGQVAGLVLQDMSFDADHHRSVWSLLGNAQAFHHALPLMVEWALEHIDMSQHRGVHPRIGALDVVPFIPLKGSDPQEALDLCHDLAQQLAQDYSLPIYLYGQAARVPQRKSLVEIRRGGFECLTQKMTSEWVPDMGPAVPHPLLGASAFGVRDIMLAFNINLDSQDLKLAQGIARGLRESSGGVRGIQALGLPLHKMNCVQVSMNIYPRQCPWGLFQVVEWVRTAAAKERVRIQSTEVIGLMPQAILNQVALDFLKPLQWQDRQILSQDFLP